MKVQRVKDRNLLKRLINENEKIWIVSKCSSLSLGWGRHMQMYVLNRFLGSMSVLNGINAVFLSAFLIFSYIVCLKEL